MKYFGRFSPTWQPPVSVRYGFAIAVSLLAALTSASLPVLAAIPFALSFLAIASTAWYAGFRAGVLSTVLSLVLVNVLVFPPAFRLGNSPAHLIQTGVLGLVAVFICAVARQREQKEERLHQVENFFETTLHSIGDAVVATDAQGFVTFLNPCAERLTEWLLKESVGRPLREIFPLINEQTGVAVENPVQKVIAEGKVVGLANHTCLISRSGKRVPIADSAAPIRTDSGELKGVVMVFRDMTQEKELELQREESERSKRELMETISEGVESFDDQWRFTFINQYGAAMSGHTPEQLLGKNHWEMFPEAIGTPFETAMRSAATEKKVSKVTEYYAPLGKWIQVAAYPARKGITVLFQDVTDSVKAQERMRVAERLATAGRIAAAVSHEINNPLAAVGNLIYLAKNSAEPSQVATFLAEAERQLFRAANIAKQTLTFYKQSSEAIEVAVSEVMKEAIALLASRIEKAKIRVSLNVEHESRVLISPGELSQIALNLLSNAVDAAPSGSEVAIQVSKKDSIVLISVTDEGAEFLGSIRTGYLNRSLPRRRRWEPDLDFGLQEISLRNTVDESSTSTLTAEGVARSSP